MIKLNKKLILRDKIKKKIKKLKGIKIFILKNKI
jgi:hypothetical protein